MGGLAFMPQEMHIIAPPVQNVKKRKFLHEWEKEDSWSRDEYDDADDLDTGTTDAGKSQVESPHKLCIQATDQTRSDEKSNKALVTWTDVDVPEGSKISKTGAAVQRIRGTSQQHSAKLDLSRVKSKHKHHKNAGVPKESCTAAISSEEMMLWPPAVVVYNTRTGKTAEGVWDGMSGKEMDNYLKGIGHSQGKSRPVWGKQGHKGLVLVKYKPNLQGLQEAERLHKHFEVNRRGRQQWLHIKAKSSGNDSEPKDGLDFVHVDAATNENKRILYGFLAGPSDVENLDPGSKIKFAVQSKSEILERQHLLEKVID
ncbi:hypothetical protein O6H91_09G040400 [Diphasiastrum complanatum]|nr:hypothetical protein O6H91_09G040400 [Diphasiastrum complanatum]